MTKREDRKKEWDERARAAQQEAKERDQEFQQYLKDQEGKPVNESKSFSWGWSIVIGAAFVILARACVHIVHPT